MVMVVELFWYDLLIKYTNLPDLKMKILFYLLNNGGLIAIALPIMSKMFGKWAIEINLDLCGAYSVDVIVIWHSSGCRRYLFRFRKEKILKICICH